MPIMIALAAVGVYFTFVTGFWQIGGLPLFFKKTFGTIFKKRGTAGISPFQAVSTALASTAGVGNIAGVATAITMGGPGAVFWMVVSAFFGMMTKYAEVLLSVKYRHREGNGIPIGGPMYVIERGMGTFFKPLAYLLCIFGIAASLGVGNLTQINTMADAMRDSFAIPPWITGSVALSLVCFVMLGGLKAIARFSEYLVPFMAMLYLCLCAIVLFICRENILPSVMYIIEGAFAPSAALGGAAGLGISQAVRYGVSRGIFSNEAGLGSSPLAHASAECDSPVEQAMWGAMEVFIDTIVMCTVTALCILSSGAYIPGEALTGAPLTSESFSIVLGEGGGIMVSICTALFALATILSWSYYGERFCEYLFPTAHSKMVYRIIYMILLLPGAVLKVELVWEIADMFNVLMAAPNLISLLVLSGVVFRETKKYKESLTI